MLDSEGRVAGTVGDGMGEQQTRVCVLIPSLRNADELAIALDGLANQTWDGPLEVVVVGPVGDPGEAVRWRLTLELVRAPQDGSHVEDDDETDHEKQPRHERQAEPAGRPPGLPPPYGHYLEVSCVSIVALVGVELTLS